MFDFLLMEPNKCQFVDELDLGDRILSTLVIFFLGLYGDTYARILSFHYFCFAYIRHSIKCLFAGVKYTSSEDYKSINNFIVNN